MTTIGQIRSKYSELIGRRNQLIENKDKINKEIEFLSKQKTTITSATEVIRNIANEAQKEFKEEIDTLVTMVIRSIFHEKFRFDLQITTNGGRLQCKPIVWENIYNEDVEYIPKDDMGGSIIDPISFAMRVVLYSFEKNKTTPLFWLDEPMKNTGHGELIEFAGNMLKTISQELGLQLVIITHEPELELIGDVVYHVERENGFSITKNKNKEEKQALKKRSLIA